MDFTATIFKRRLVDGLEDSKKTIVDPRQQSESGLTVDLSKLLNIAGDDRFVNEAYRRILRRESDPGGQSHYCVLLRDGYARTSVLRQLTQSDEARATGFRYVGLTNSLTATLAANHSGWKRNIRLWLLERVRLIHAFTLRVFRIERIELKLDYAMAETTTLADRQSVKLDNTLVTISEKLDQYVMDLNVKQHHIAEQVEQQQRSIYDGVTQLSARIDQLSEKTSQLADDEIKQLAERIDSIAAFTSTQLQQTENIGQSMHESVNQLSLRIQELESQSIHRLDQLESGMNSMLKSQRPPIFPAGDNVLATEVDGFILGIPADEWRLAAYYALRGVPEPGMIKLFRRMVQPGMVIVDVGAHIGLYTLYALRGLNGTGKVFSFEPSPRTFVLLKDNIQVNGFLESGIARVFQLAVTAQTGEAKLTIVKNNSGHNSLYASSQPGEQLPTKTTSLDEILVHETRVDIVKIDAEGAEPFILQGMKQLRQNNPKLHIFLEFAPEHLRRAGLDPLNWAKEMVASEPCLHRVDDVSGELLAVTAEELATCISWNLLLSPKPAVLCNNN